MGKRQAGKPLTPPSTVATSRRAAAGRIVRGAAFFIPFYVYVWLVIEPAFLFHGAGIVTNFPSFYCTRRFFAEHLSYPGGLVEYASAFLSQLFCYSWLGALIITVQTWALCLCVAYVLRGSGLKKLAFVGYIPPLLLLALYGQYTYYMPTITALLVTLVFACIYVGVAQRKAWRVNLIAFLALSFVSYYTAGGGSLLFAAICVIHELLSRRWAFGLGYAVLGAVLPYAVGVLGFDLYAGDAYSQLLPISWKLLNYEARSRSVSLVYALYLLVPVVMAVGGVVRILWARHLRRRGDAGSTTRRRRKRTRLSRISSWYRSLPRLEWLVQTTVLLALGAATAFGTIDHDLKTQLAVDYHAYHKMWPEVIATGMTHADDLFVMHAVDRALYHTGRLGNEMFRWPQRPKYLFLTGTDEKRAFWGSIDVYLEVGHINGAEHALTECLEGLGDRPMVLQRLALINMVKGNIGTARVYLGALSGTLFHRGWARQYLGLLDRDPNLSTDAHVQHLRSIAMDRDFPSVILPPETMLQYLLSKNSANRMAFEYLMTWYLLNRQLAKFTGHLGEFRDLGYGALPIHFEEAAVAYVFGARKPLYLGGYEPRADVRRRAEHFVGIMKRYSGNERAALPELVKYHYGTYFFYNVYAQPDGEQ